MMELVFFISTITTYIISLTLDRAQYYVLSGLVFGAYNVLMYFRVCKVINYFGLDTSNILLIFYTKP